MHRMDRSSNPLLLLVIHPACLLTTLILTASYGLFADMKRDTHSHLALYLTISYDTLSPNYKYMPGYCSVRFGCK